MSDTFGSLIVGQMFLIPEGESGQECLWIKKSTGGARSYPPVYGCCSFCSSDQVIEVDTTGGKTYYSRSEKLILYLHERVVYFR